MDFQFQYPQAFWLLLAAVLILLLFWSYRSWKKRAVKAIGDEALVKSLIPQHSVRKEHIKLLLIVLAFVLGTITLANPRQPDTASGEERKGIDVFLVLDVSNSMLATDVPPVRLQRAQQLLSNLVDQMQSDRLGLILFAGHAYLQMPLSTDHGSAKFFISTAHPNAVPEGGTAIGDALKKADEAFDKGDRFKTVILVTDGETHDEDAITVAQDLAKKGIMVNTVGIGSVEGSTIIDPDTKSARRDASGEIIISKLNEELLRNIAAATNGTYVHLQQTGAAVSQIMQQYQNVERKALPDFSSMKFQSFYWWFALPMLLLLIFETFMPDKKRNLS